MTAISSRVTSVASMLERRTRKSPGSRGDLTDEISEANPFMLRAAAVPLDAVMAEMDAGEDHFAVAAIDQSADFVEDVRDWAAGKMGADLRDDAEAAIQAGSRLAL